MGPRNGTLRPLGKEARIREALTIGLETKGEESAQIFGAKGLQLERRVLRGDDSLRGLGEFGGGILNSSTRGEDNENRWGNLLSLKTWAQGTGIKALPKEKLLWRCRKSKVVGVSSSSLAELARSGWSFGGKTQKGG